MAKIGDKRAPLELLSPARDEACGVAAIGCGADAVYIGGPAFSARSQASNSLADIEKLASYAHRYNARVYVALNTLIFDDELEVARKLALGIEEAGADALIVQDMALAEFGLSIPLHASTQCDNRTPEKVAFLEKCGFSQVVLARELTIPEIAAIASATEIRLECFVHGALCVSYSGQCHLSREMTGRSANRGNCGQPCRLPSGLFDPATGAKLGVGHLLSLKDMNRSGYLGELADAGVSSFKIEGRLKDLSYVRNVTAHYRRELDAVIEGRPGYRRASSGRSFIAFRPDPAKSFNRGFTPYLLDRDKAGIESFDTPKWLGEEIGRVRRADAERVEIVGEAELANGDGLAWFSETGELKGLRVNRAEGRLAYPAKPFDRPQIGATFYRNCDAAFERTLATAEAVRKIGADLTFSETPGGFALHLADEGGFTAQASIDSEKTEARDPDGYAEAIEKQLVKLGGTLFTAGKVEVSLPRPFFIRPSSLNALRREAVEKLLDARLAGYVREARTPEETPPAPFPSLPPGSCLNATNRLAVGFYRRHGVEVDEPAWEQGGGGRIPLMTAKHCLRRSFKLCRKTKGAANAPPLLLKIGPRSYDLEFDCGKCEMRLYPRRS